MAASRNIVVAGAGIGGLATALALAQRGFRAVVIEEAERLEAVGAGIQLSPNATRVLIELGLKDRLMADAVEPQGIDIRSGEGRFLTRVPLGAFAAERYGAPYWVTHRGDLQAALVEAARAAPDVVLRLGTRVEDFVSHGNGVTVGCRCGPQPLEEAGIGLICADGLWSGLRLRLGHWRKPAFRGRSAWRALVEPGRLAPDLRGNLVRLWLGERGHLVQYPVRAGTLVNIVAVVEDSTDRPGWSEPGTAADLAAHFPRGSWDERARELVAAPERWHKWALYDLPPLRRWGDGPVTLLGDAAHPMLPFLAQGGAMAIEDAAVLAACLAQAPQDVAAAMRRYERERRSRTRRAQRGAKRNGRAYHLAGPQAALRDLYLRAASGKMLLRRYDWLYAWRPPPLRS